jgi:hypothetical protein
MHPFRSSASLRIFCQSVDPAEISIQLGWEPTWQHKAGAPRTTPQGSRLVASTTAAIARSTWLDAMARNCMSCLNGSSTV